jgi:hypothetical protein
MPDGILIEKISISATLIAGIVVTTRAVFALVGQWLARWDNNTLTMQS